MTRPESTGTDLLVLHALRCIGFAGLERVAAATGLPQADVESELIDLAVAGLVARVLDRLTDLDRRAEVVCAALSAALPRFGRYRVRLADALARARSGALEHVTDSTASYHIVWFQLHEDLLATLGIPR